MYVVFLGSEVTGQLKLETLSGPEEMRVYALEKIRWYESHYTAGELAQFSLDELLIELVRLGRLVAQHRTELGVYSVVYGSNLAIIGNN